MVGIFSAAAADSRVVVAMATPGVSSAQCQLCVHCSVVATGVISSSGSWGVIVGHGSNCLASLLPAGFPEAASPAFFLFYQLLNALPINYFLLKLVSHFLLLEPGKVPMRDDLHATRISCYC